MAREKKETYTNEEAAKYADPDCPRCEGKGIFMKGEGSFTMSGDWNPGWPAICDCVSRKVLLRLRRRLGKYLKK